MKTEPVRPADPCCPHEEERYYVSVIDGRRKALLFGPVLSRELAELLVPHVRRWAESVQRDAHFFSFGVAAVRGCRTAGRCSRWFPNAPLQSKCAEHYGVDPRLEPDAIARRITGTGL